MAKQQEQRGGKTPDPNDVTLVGHPAEGYQNMDTVKAAEQQRFGRVLEPQERATLTQVASSIATPALVPPAPGLHRYKVSLRHNPAMTLEARDEHEAQRLYMKAQNILGSEWPVEVVEVH